MDDPEAGKDFHKWGESGKAIECHEKDLEIAIKIGDQAGEGEAYGNLRLRLKWVTSTKPLSIRKNI